VLGSKEIYHKGVGCRIGDGVDAPKYGVLRWALENSVLTYSFISGFGGLGVSMLASGTQDRGFAPDRSRRIFPAGKIHSMPSLGGEGHDKEPSSIRKFLNCWPNSISSFLR
jgi:hypothetical protein